MLAALVLAATPGCSDGADDGNGTGSARLTYEADDGPGAVGDTIDPAELGIGGATEAATKIGRRTYRLPEEGGATTFVVPPQRWKDAEAAAIEARRAPDVADCDALATHDAAAADAALEDMTAAALDDLDVVDRQYAVSERLLPMLEDSRAFVEATPCDLVELAVAMVDQLAPSTREVMARALPPLDLTGSTPVEREPSLDPQLVAGLLRPVER